MKKLANAKNCNEDLFDSIYKSLYNLSAKENNDINNKDKSFHIINPFKIKDLLIQTPL